MKTDNLIQVATLCTVYNIDEDLVSELEQHGIIETILVEDRSFIEEEDLSTFEKVLRMHRDLNINLEGIDVIFNLLQKIEFLNNRLYITESRLRIYE